MAYHWLRLSSITWKENDEWISKSLENVECNEELIDPYSNLEHTVNE